MPSDPPAPADPPGGSLAPLDRAAFERVLARATELQAHLSDAPDGLTERQLLDLGNEVGISADHLKQALAEERTRVVLPEESGVVGSWFGSTRPRHRVVPGTERSPGPDRLMDAETGTAPRATAHWREADGKLVVTSWAACRRASTSAVDHALTPASEVEQRSAVDANGCSCARRTSRRPSAQRGMGGRDIGWHFSGAGSWHWYRYQRNLALAIGA
jgi:hypothetical protein